VTRRSRWIRCDGGYSRRREIRKSGLRGRNLSRSDVRRVRLIFRFTDRFPRR